MIDYEAFIAQAAFERQDAVTYLVENLPYAWCDEYRMMTRRPSDLCRFAHDGFEFIFDNGALQAADRLSSPVEGEDRLVAVHGCSRPHTQTREASRIQGWIGPTGRFLGLERDKGHFIGCALGGRMDGLEINMFAQLRHVNRGWSTAGKRFRSMERYCVDNPGTYCFNRPLYYDSSSRPSAFEFGVLTTEHRSWVECFEN